MAPVQSLHIGQRLKRARETRGLTAKRVANTMELSASQISKMESGQQRIPADLLPPWCETLGISLADAFGTVASEQFSLVPFSPRIARMYANLPNHWQLHVQRAVESLHRLYERHTSRS